MYFLFIAQRHKESENNFGLIWKGFFHNARSWFRFYLLSTSWCTNFRYFNTFFEKAMNIFSIKKLAGFCTFVASKWLQVANQRFHFNSFRPRFLSYCKIRVISIYATFIPKSSFFNLGTSHFFSAFLDRYFILKKIIHSNHLFSRIHHFICYTCQFTVF